MSNVHHDEDMAGKAVALIDGQCVMCNSISQWYIARDSADIFRFASLQSSVGQRLLREGGMPDAGMDTFVLIDGGRYYTRSTAALRALKRLGGRWRLVYGFIIVPRFIRDGVYSFIARNRYRWFGKTESCPIPTPQLRSKFLDWDEQ